jgi:hypothetical protein
LLQDDTPYGDMLHLSFTKSDKHSRLPYVDTNTLPIMWLKNIHVMISEESLQTLSPHVLHVGIYGSLTYVPHNIKTISLCNDLCIEGHQSIEAISAVCIRVANCPNLHRVTCSAGIIVGCNNLTHLTVYQQDNTMISEEGDRIIVDTNDPSIYSTTQQLGKICLRDIDCDMGDLIFNGDASKIKHLTCNYISYKTLQSMGLGNLNYYCIQSDWLYDDIRYVNTLEYDLFRTERVFVSLVENLIVNIGDLEDGIYYPISCTTISTLKIKAEYSYLENSIPDAYSNIYVIVETLPNIISMELDDCCIMLHSQSTLKHLKLRKFILDYRIDILPTFENLSTLHVIDIDYNLIKSIIAPNLETLTIHWTDNRYSHTQAMDFVMYLVRSFPMLKSIEVEPPYSILMNLR